MKKFVILFVLAIIFGLGYLYTKGLGTENPLEEGSLETEVSAGEKSLWGVTDRANMVMVASVGLGREERRKVISGRLYQNFVQLLKTNGVMDDKLTFSDDCNTGARLEFYRDTVLVGEYRLTDRIGKDSSDGVWLPRRISKVYKFLRDQGAQLMPCGNDRESATAMDSTESSRPTLTMPKFGAARKAKKNLEREASVDSLVNQAVGRSKPVAGMMGETQNALKILDEMIMAQDTAVGEPLVDLLKRVNRIEVSFYDDSTGKELKKMELTSDQMDSLKKLLSQGRYETFAITGDVSLVQFVRVTLFDELTNLGELVPQNQKYGHWLKKKGTKNGGYSFTGHWIPENPEALKSFFSIFPQDL